MSGRSDRRKPPLVLSNEVGAMLGEAEQAAVAVLLHFLEEHAKDFPTLEEEFANLSGAVACAARDDSVVLADLLGPLGAFLYERGHWAFAVAYLPVGIATSRRIENPWREALLGAHLGVIASAQGDQARARVELERARALAHRLGDTTTCATAACGLAQVCAAEGDYDGAERYFAEGYAWVQQRGGPPDTGLRHTLAMLRAARGDFGAALRAYRDNLREARNTHDVSGTARALFGVGTTLMEIGRHSRASTYLRLARSCAVRAGDVVTKAAALHSLAMEEARQGRQSAAYRLYLDSLTLSRRLGDQRGIGRTLAQIGELFLDFHVFDSAARHYREALDTLSEVRDRQGQAVVFHQLGNVYLHQRRYDDARAAYDQSLAIKRDLGDERGIGLTLACLGEVARWQGDAGEARRLWTQSLAILRPLGMPEAAEVARWLGSLGAVPLG